MNPQNIEWLTSSFQHAQIISGYYDRLGFFKLADEFRKALAKQPDVNLTDPEADLSWLMLSIAGLLDTIGYGGDSNNAALRVVDMACLAAEMERSLGPALSGDELEQARRAAHEAWLGCYEVYNRFDDTIEMAIDAFFEQNPHGDIPMPAKGDISVLDAAAYASRLSLRLAPAENAFLTSIGLEWSTAQEEALRSLAGQVVIADDRRQANFSVRTAWAGLHDTRAMLAVAYVLGVEKDALSAAAKAAEAAGPAGAADAVRAAVTADALIAAARRTAGF